MKLEKLKEEILPFLEEGGLTKYELACAKEKNPASIFEKLKVLEAAGFVKQLRQGRNVKWQKVEQEQKTEPTA